MTTSSLGGHLLGRRRREHGAHARAAPLARRAVGGERERHRAVDDAQRALDRRRERARAEEEGEAAERLGDLGDEERRLRRTAAPSCRGGTRKRGSPALGARPSSAESCAHGGEEAEGERPPGGASA